MNNVTSMLVFQRGKTFCASFCASLIACVCLSRSVRVLRLNEIHEVRTFAPCKGFFFVVFAVVLFCHLKITLHSEQPMLE